MLLFVGETCASPHRSPRLPEIPAVQHTEWATVKSKSTTIKYCDFSTKKNKTAIHTSRTAGISGNPVPTKKSYGNSSYYELLADEIVKGHTSLLNDACGVFCGFALDTANDRLALFTDYLGFRQIFLFKTETGLVFSNALWLIERTLPKDTPFDEKAVIEIGVLGHPLENRTRREGVTLLPPGCLLTVDGTGTPKYSEYCSLINTKSITLDDEDALEALHEVWTLAVTDRISEEHPFAFLSGGMDSRLLVHTLKANGTSPQTANFAPLGSMDRVYAENMANRLGVALWLHPDGNPNIDFVADTVRTWTKSDLIGPEAFVSKLIWSGDGGSVGLGHVYLDDEMIDLSESAQFVECASRFCEVNKRRPVARAYKNKNATRDFEGRIAALLESYAKTSPNRAPYFFLMLNDQRRHLDKHYESLHTRGFDFELPFFDRRLISLVSSMPAKDFNMHRMYHKLFMKIGGLLVAEPWQTYPGHVPCPLPRRQDLEYQWGGNFYHSTTQRRKMRISAWKCLQLALAQPPKQKIFNTRYLAIASLMTLTGVSDHSYLYQCISPTASNES